MHNTTCTNPLPVPQDQSSHEIDIYFRLLTGSLRSRISNLAATRRNDLENHLEYLAVGRYFTGYVGLTYDHSRFIHKSRQNEIFCNLNREENGGTPGKYPIGMQCVPGHV